MMISLRPGMEKDSDEVITADRYSVQEMRWISSEVLSGYVEMCWRFFRQTVAKMLFQSGIFWR